MQNVEISNHTWRETQYVVIRKPTAADRAAERQKRLHAHLASANKPTLSPTTGVDQVPTPDTRLDTLPVVTEPHVINSIDLPAITIPLPIRMASPIAKISKAEAAAIREAGFASLSFYGTATTVPHGLGDPVGVRPILAYVGSSWKDTLSAQMDRISPTFHCGLQDRIWLRSKREAKHLCADVSVVLSAEGCALRNGWINVGVSVDLQALRLKVIALAKRNGLETFDDMDVLQFARGQVAKVKPN